MPLSKAQVDKYEKLIKAHPESEILSKIQENFITFFHRHDGNPFMQEAILATSHQMHLRLCERAGLDRAVLMSSDPVRQAQPGYNNVQTQENVGDLNVPVGEVSAIGINNDTMSEELPPEMAIDDTQITSAGMPDNSMVVNQQLDPTLARDTSRHEEQEEAVLNVHIDTSTGPFPSNMYIAATLQQLQILQGDGGSVDTALIIGFRGVEILPAVDRTVFRGDSIHATSTRRDQFIEDLTNSRWKANVNGSLGYVRLHPWTINAWARFFHDVTGVKGWSNLWTVLGYINNFPVGARGFLEEKLGAPTESVAGNALMQAFVDSFERYRERKDKSSAYHRLRLMMEGCTLHKLYEQLAVEIANQRMVGGLASVFGSSSIGDTDMGALHHFLETQYEVKPEVLNGVLLQTQPAYVLANKFGLGILPLISHENNQQLAAMIPELTDTIAELFGRNLNLSQLLSVIEQVVVLPIGANDFDYFNKLRGSPKAAQHNNLEDLVIALQQRATRI